MVEARSQSVYGAQPRSLNINWMKFDVTDENLHPNTVLNQPIRLSPLRLKLRERADQVLEKRSNLTQTVIERKIEEARLRREATSHETQFRRIEPKMRRSEAQVARAEVKVARS